jgi:predicted permease
MAAGMLAVAIGTTAAMFTVADHMLFRPAPFRDPDHLVRVLMGNEKSRHAYDIVRTLRTSPAFTEVEAFVQDPVILESASGPISRGAVWLTPGTFHMLDVRPLMGRVFALDDGRPGNEDRVVISETLWRNDFGADPAIIGRAITLSGTQATVVGVMPASFEFPYINVKIWRPLDISAPPARLASRSLEVFARLSPKLPEADASRIATAAANQIVPSTRTDDRVSFRAASSGSVGYSRTTILVLGAGVGLVFLLLCANVTNLILARTMARRQEFGVCSALGASRGRLLRQALIENAMIGLVASGMGVVAAWGLVSLARGFLPLAFLNNTLNPLALDPRALLATSAFGLAATIAAGLPPAWIGTSMDPSSSLRLASRGGTESRASRRWTRSLLIGEVALASALLVGAGVLVQSFTKLVIADRGLDSHGVVTAWISLPRLYFTDVASRTTFAETLQDQMRGLPGVTGVALSYGMPPGGGETYFGEIDTDGSVSTPASTVVGALEAGPDFFSLYRINVIEGRGFQSGDTSDQVVVGESLARMLWPGASAVGRAFTFRGSKEWYHVVGVAREIRLPSYVDPRENDPHFYRPLTMGRSEVMIGLRCGDVCPGETAIRDRLRGVSARAMVSSMSTLDDAYLEQFAKPRAAAGLAFAFALVAVVASAGGLFSVLSYAVGRRRREFGIRAAMGAQPAQLRRLVFRDGLRIAGMGLTIGAVAAWTLSRSLAALAFGVTAYDPLVWLTVVAVIGGATLLASWRPALAAMRSNPLNLLRDE